MKRRTYLLVGGGLLAGAQYKYDIYGDLVEHPFVQNHKWEGERLVVKLQEDHDSDFWSIVHQKQDIEDESLISGESPEFDGPIRINIKNALNETDVTYPSPKFKMLFVEGEYTGWINLVDEVLGKFNFKVPSEARGNGNID